MKISMIAFLSEEKADPGAIARRCEDLGFEALFFPEHPVIPVSHRTPFPAGGPIPEFYSHMPDPFVLLSLAAANTTRLRIGTGICLVAERNPLLLAKEIATLDRYSGGRFIFGVGGGWLADETEIMGADFRRRWPITREYIAAMKELWSRSEAGFQGKFISFPAVRSYPKPVQKPHPPIFIGAAGERALKNVVAFADGWMPLHHSAEQIAQGVTRLRELCSEAGRRFEDLEISVSGPKVAKGEGPKEARERYRAAGVHRIILSVHKLAPREFEAELEQLAKEWMA